MSESVWVSEKKSKAAKEDRTLQTRKSDYSQSINSSVDHILFLQRTIGNQAVGRLIRSGALQAKLRIGQPGDIYEQEADRVAEQVMRMPDVSSGKDTSVQRKCPKCRKVLTGLLGKDKKDEKLQAKETAGKTPEVTPQTVANITALKDGGQPLPESTRAFFETRFGHDFSQVRVHTDAKAAEVARAVNAWAFTVGKDVVFGEGQHAPETTAGKNLLAHELTHTIQQGAVGTLEPVVQPTRSSDVNGGLVQRMREKPSLGEIVNFPRISDIVKSPTVEAARQQDWEVGLKDFQERGAWILWLGSPRDPSTGVRDDTLGTYEIVNWPLPSVGAANDDEQTENPNDAIEPGTPPANDSLRFVVGNYHQHPPLDPSLHRDPAGFPVGPSPNDVSIANTLGSPGMVRDFTDTNRTVVRDYFFGPDVQVHK